MNSSKGEVYMALLCLAFCIGYGISAASIEVPAGWDKELITSRTFPYALTLIGAISSLTILYGALSKRADVRSSESAGSYHWRQCSALVGAALTYAAIMPYLGFVMSTAGFLAAGCMLLGERRWRVVIPAAVLPPIIFWLLLELGLDIKLPSMDFWRT